MTNPTSNYGFVLPTATDLVTDLPADFDVALQGVDTRLKALNPETTLGDLSFQSATANTKTRLGIGTAGQVLGVSGGVPAWVTSADQTPLTTKGDLFTFTTADARLGVGANDTVLTADSSTATGLKWAAPASGGMTLISTTTLSGASVTLSSIPNTYTDLVLYIRDFQASTGSNFACNINNVSSASTQTELWGRTSGAPTSGTWNQAGVMELTTMQAFYQSGNNNNSLVATFYDYANTATWKNTQVTYGVQTASGVYYSGVIAAYWQNTAAISSLVLSGQGTYSGGTALLYGVK